LFAIAEYLRARRTGVTAEALATKFDVTIRTIYRDLDELRDAALPVTAEQGRGGGYALEKHYSLPPVNFTAREAALLLTVTGYATRLRVVPFVETLESGAQKVRAALSTSAQRELLSLLDRLEFTGVPAPATRPAVRGAVEDALVADLPLRVRFRRADSSVSERTVRVERLVLERSRTLLNVVDVETGERRQYPLDQVERAEVVSATPH
jgi:predicted DNA-binding transcriptional regulator YafY